MKMLEKFNKTETITHYILPDDDEKDWNDYLKDLGHEQFAKFILKRIKSV